MALVSRFIEYRRSRWFTTEENLETLLRTAWRELPNNTDRVIERPDGTSVMGLDMKDYGKLGIALHCARYIERQSVGVVNMMEKNAADLTERPPGNAENFLNSDFMAIISGNHVITLNAGQNAASLRFYLQELFRQAELPDEAGRFEIVRIADADQLKRIEAIGAKSIGLNVSIDKATASTVGEGASRRTVFSNLLEPLTNLVDGLVGRDDKTSQIGSSQKGTLKISINIPKGDLEAARSGLDGVAEALVQDDEAEEFVIFLRNGELIRPGEIAVRKSVRLERYSNTVNKNDVWAEMASYMDELERSGHLET